MRYRFRSFLFERVERAGLFLFEMLWFAPKRLISATRRASIGVARRSSALLHAVTVGSLVKSRSDVLVTRQASIRVARHHLSRASVSQQQPRRESGCVYLPEELATGSIGVPSNWSRVEVQVTAHPQNGLGLILDFGTNAVAEIWELGGIAQKEADVRVGDRVIALRATGDPEVIECNGRPLTSLLSSEPLVGGYERGWIFTVARAPNAPPRALAPKILAVHNANI
mmetsp:Transcript_37120/g.61457  ORF Transcript_37120/g.61457 Transcript_37120/m.61457 type:complete len:226 (+) Transcript_37120:120-797(+)|eukprot:CAMPEP_0119305798 /NCGR_PEP_ID=MMETSP1333-20130426/6705_1 /TAXON_ID=418940 /ORGANISM="Scyphosphaera apsteinii, Strain RCC1455" /LENGTH=225 /DNA_ID=CAMNT_0007308973 /DNA_START=117 /DNA_END=794 /DNA_ORIENTATION=-